MAANGSTPAPSEESIDSATFSSRLQTLYFSWEASRTSLWGDAEALAVASGPGSEDLRYLKSSALQLWLLGFEFPETIMVFLAGAVHFICSKKKAGMLETAKASFPEDFKVQVQIHVKGRSDDGATQIAAVLTALKESSGPTPTVGWLPKEKPEGDLMTRWASALSASGATLVDAAPGLAYLLATKDEAEIVNVKRAALLAAQVLKMHAIVQVEEIIDQEKTVTHAKLSEDAEAALLEPSRVKVKLRAENVDLAYPPIFQSGGEYDIRPAAESSPGALDFGTCGVILLAIGAKYNSYCATLARSLLIDSTKQQEQVYKALLRAQEAIIAALRPGARLADVYQAGLAVVQADAPDAVPFLSKTFGSSIGLELREGTYSISPKSKETVRPHMCFNVALGVQQVPNPGAPPGASREYALLLADTVIVKQDQAEVATASCSRAWNEIAYSFKDGDDEEPDVKPPPPPPRRAAATVDAKNTLRSEKELNKEEERKRTQAELVAQKNEETRRRILDMANGGGGGAGGGATGGTGRGGGEVVAYRGVDDIPSSRELMIQVDQRNEAVLLPIYGLMVPFHVATIKNVTSSQDGGISLIRINFNVPGAAFGAGYTPAVKYPDSVFLREVSYRSSDARHSNQVVQLLKTMRRQVAQRENERAERATLVTQERLQLLKGRAPRLSDVWIRPNFGGRGKKATGTLEAHANGFRYATNKADERLDIMYGNIKHAVFQPADNEMITLIHFHLHHPIMLGKKKTQDVQFYAEVMDVVQTVHSGRRAMYDPDEIEEEQRERERRNKINKDFENFVKRAQELFGQLDLEFDVPFNQFAFTGVPFKTSAKIIPCVNCLVSLIEVPFLVVTLDEIEIVSLERVGMSKKSFDMTIVFKDFRKDVHRIDAIPTASLEMIKDWLTSMKIKYYENRLNLVWKPILRTILDDPDKFLEDGGWEFLNADASDEEGGSDEESDAYEPSDEDAASESSEEEDDESVVASDEDDEDGSSGSDEDEEEGMDWDELEEQAAREDRDRSDEDDSEDDRRRKKGKGRPPDRRGGPPNKKMRR